MHSYLFGSTRRIIRNKLKLRKKAIDKSDGDKNPLNSVELDKQRIYMTNSPEPKKETFFILIVEIAVV